MANDYVFANEYFQGASKVAKQVEFGMGRIKTDWDDINYEDERISPASMDVFLWFYWIKI